MTVNQGRGNIRSLRLADKMATAAFWVLAGTVVMILAFLVGYVFVNGWSSVDWTFLTSPAKNMDAGGGIGPQIFDSFYLLVLSMLITAPLGVGAAVYMSEYASNSRFQSAIRLATETLASLPSVVAGLFGLLFFVTLSGWGYSLMAGAFTLTILNLPVAYRVSEDAIRELPRELREGSLALGATKWQTATRVLLPAAMPRIITGLILTAGRVFGEAAAIMFTAGMSAPPLDWRNFNPLSFRSPLNPFRPAETLAVHIWKVNSESLIPDVRRVADGSALVLVATVLVFNAFAKWLGKTLHKRLTGQ